MDESAYYRAKKKHVVKEIKEQNEQAEIKDLNRQFTEQGLDIEVTEKVHWRPGDPVENTGHALLKADWEHMLQVKAPDLYMHYLRDEKAFWEAYDENLMTKYGMNRDDLHDGMNRDDLHERKEM